MSFAEWQQQTGIILGGAFLFTKVVAKAMIGRGRGGAIINIISTAGHQGEPGNIAHCSAKKRPAEFHPVSGDGTCRSWHPGQQPDSHGDGSDGIIRSHRAVGSFRQSAGGLAERITAFRTRVPMQKLPEPSDYGRAVAFLASEAAAMITGTDLRVDAGAIARYWAWQPADAAAR